MSEYQIVKFRAVDRPLTDKQLEFMDRQSSRAEFTNWEYEVEYDYSSFHGDVDGVEWPVTASHRTLTQLLDTCESLRQKADEKRAREAAAKAKREADKAEKQRQARMTTMKSIPEPWLVKASELVETRGTENYREAASILADLRDAVGGEAGNRLARKHAAHLVKKHPTLNVLKSSLRKQQLLD